MQAVRPVEVRAEIDQIRVEKPPKPSGDPHTESFREILERVARGLDGSSDPFQSTVDFERSVMKGEGFTPHEILVFQIRASQFSVHVELLSRAAESGLSMIRRLQQIQ